MPSGRLPQYEALIGVAPCDSCRHWSACKEFGTACVRFKMYTKGAAQHRWMLMPNEPRLDLGKKMGFVTKTDAELAALLA